MSHSAPDAVGGHRGTGLVYGDGFYSHSLHGRRWAKKFNRREARREARNAEKRAVAEYYEDEAERINVEWEDDHWYEHDWYDEWLESEREDRWIDEPYEYEPEWYDDTPMFYEYDAGY